MGLRKIFVVLLMALGVLSLLTATTFLAAAIYALATIPAGKVNDAGFGFVFAFFFGVVGLFLFGLGRKSRVRPHTPD